MPDETQSQIYQTYTSSGQQVWINLAHVVSVVQASHIDKPIRVLHVALSNNDRFEISRCPYRSDDPNGTDLTQFFLYALNAFHDQNK